MLFLISLVLAAAFAWLCAGVLRRHPLPFYIGAAAVTTGMIVIGLARPALPSFVQTYVIGIFTHGALAAALWCVVAFVGAVQSKAVLRRLMPARGELSIFAAIVTLSHAVTYGVVYVRQLLSGRTPSGAEFLLTCVICLVLMAIMLPLTVISFKAVRRRMNARRWKHLQRAAYVFYALILLHVLVIFLPRARAGREGALLSVLVYSAVFLGYAALRIRKWVLAHKKTARPAVVNTVCTTACLAVCAALMAAAVPVPEKLPAGGRASAEAAVPETQGDTQPAPEMTDASGETAQTQAATRAQEPDAATDATEDMTAEETQDVTGETLEAGTEENTDAAGEELPEGEEPVQAENGEAQPAADAQPDAGQAAPAEVQQAGDGAVQNAGAAGGGVSGGASGNTSGDTSGGASGNAAGNTAGNASGNTSAPAENTAAGGNTSGDTAGGQQSAAPAVQEEQPAAAPAPDPEPAPEPEPEPEPVYVYRDGTYSASAYGYDGDVHVTLTIVQDVITDLTATSDEWELAYFDSAYGTVRGRILETQSTSVDAVSGATFSSNAIMQAAAACLAQARN